MTNPDILVEALNRITPDLGAGFTHVEELRRLSGGASQETWKFSGVGGTDKKPLILRRSPSTTANEMPSGGIGLKAEARLLSALPKGTLPVPEVLHVSETGDALGASYVMTCLEGETIPRRILRSLDGPHGGRVLAEDCGHALAALHSLPQDGFAFLPKVTAADQLEQYGTILHALDADRPVLELGLQWLSRNIPEPVEPSLVHGDFRLGNLMVLDGRLSGILDWELSHLGDPREDIGWLTVNSWRFGQSDNRVGGFASLEDLLSAYNVDAKAPIHAQDIDYWEILGSFKWGVMCLMMYEAFRNGTDPSIERAAIGRRASEAEIDLINLLENRI